MGWDAGIAGRVTFDAKARKVWLASAADSKSALGLTKHVSKRRFGPMPMADALEAVAKIELPYLRFDWKKALSIEALLDEDAYLDHAPAIAAVFAGALASGGKGELVLCAVEGASFAWSLGARGIVKTKSDRPEIAALERRYRSASAAPKLPALPEQPVGQKAPRGKVWVYQPFLNKVLLVPRVRIPNVERAREIMIANGYDPDTGEKKR